MDSPEFKPFELKDFDSEVSVQEADALETDGFKPMNYSAGEDYAVLGEVDEKTETEKIDLSENFHTDHFQREDSLLTNAEDYARNIREGAQHSINRSWLQKTKLPSRKPNGSNRKPLPFGNPQKRKN